MDKGNNKQNKEEYQFNPSKENVGNDHHSFVTTIQCKLNEKDPPPAYEDSFDFDKFVRKDADWNNGRSAEVSQHGDPAIQFHTGYSMPSGNKSNVIINNTVVLNEKSLIERKQSSSFIFTSLFIRQATLMSLWFLTSFCSILLNKYILSVLDTDAAILGFCQIVMTTFFGSCMMYFPCGRCHKIKVATNSESFNRYHFLKTVSILGWLRFGSIICSIIGLKYVAVSFSETIKSSAPLFTALIAYFLLGEYSGLFVNLSLFPIMIGLGISSSTELSFNMTGFLAAVANNILDCFQNVFSKKLLSAGDHRFSPLELQFYTSVAATIIQLPFWFLLMDMQQKVKRIDRYLGGILLLNGVIFYAQSLFAYSLMSLISPITFSVSNTVKRAGLIWFSVIVFGNSVTVLSAFGTFLVVFGVFLYQRARHLEAADRAQMAEAKAAENAQHNDVQTK